MQVLVALALFPVLAFSRALSLMPTEWIGIFGWGLGNTLLFLGFRKKIVSGNLDLAFGKELTEVERKRLLKKIYIHIGTLFIEIARNFTMTAKQRIEEMQVSDEDLNRIKSYLSPGMGAIFISGHLANWELFATGLAARGIPGSIIVKKMNNPVSQAILERQRNLTQIELIYSGGVLERIKENLKRGRAIGFILDQNTTGKKGIRVNFFGVPASSIKGLATVVRETKAKVIPMCAFRQPSGKHKLYIGQPIPYLTADTIPDGPERMAREEWLNTQQYQSAFEQLVRMHPEQWLWIHRRWKADRTPLVPGKEHLENLI